MAYEEAIQEAMKSGISLQESFEEKIISERLSVIHSELAKILSEHFKRYGINEELTPYTAKKHGFSMSVHFAYGTNLYKIYKDNALIYPILEVSFGNRVDNTFGFFIKKIEA